MNITFDELSHSKETSMKRFAQTLGLAALTAGLIGFVPSVVSPETAFLGHNSVASAQTQTTTLPAPSGVPDGSAFVLFGQGWGQEFTVSGGQVTLPWGVGAQATFGNFRLPNGQWYRLGDLTSLPPGWGSVILGGVHALGNPLATDSVEAFSDSNTFALVGPVWDDNALSSFSVSYSGGQVILDLPSDRNSISFSAANADRNGFGLSTGGSRGLVNVGQLLDQTDPHLVFIQNGRLVMVPMTRSSGNVFTAQLAAGQHFQIVYVKGDTIQAWSTVGAAQLSNVTDFDGNGPTIVGPYSYLAGN